MTADNQRTSLHDFADEIGMYFEEKGLPRIPGRIFGWLLVCDPPYQSAEELATELQISRGSISTAMQMMTRGGSVERHHVRGSRRTYYRVRPGRWLDEAAKQARQAAEMVKVADRGLEMLAGASPEQRQRLQEMHDMYDFLSEEYSLIESKWRRRQQEQ
ncbi:MAG: GbsR/MarR family transcriptional regulator [Stackebrandtia sp.]